MGKIKTLLLSAALLICFCGSSHVRVRVQDSTGTNYGSGTIIQSTKRSSYVLTCGHVLRNEGTIKVDVFEDGGYETFEGQFVAFDLEDEVGMVLIFPHKLLSYSKIESFDYNPKVGDKVYSIGCSHGHKPSVEGARITAINRYRGADTIECNRVPEHGRSGGALIDKNDKIIGICFAGNEDDEKGIYSSLKPIYDLVDRVKRKGYKLK